MCDCAGTLRKKLDFDELGESLRQLPSVKTVKVCSDFCGRDGCADAVESILQDGSTRAVIGACDCAV